MNESICSVVPATSVSYETTKTHISATPSYINQDMLVGLDLFRTNVSKSANLKSQFVPSKVDKNP